MDPGIAIALGTATVTAAAAAAAFWQARSAQRQLAATEAQQADQAGRISVAAAASTAEERRRGLERARTVATEVNAGYMTIARQYNEILTLYLLSWSVRQLSATKAKIHANFAAVEGDMVKVVALVNGNPWVIVGTLYGEAVSDATDIVGKLNAKLKDGSLVSSSNFFKGHRIEAAKPAQRILSDLLDKIANMHEIVATWTVENYPGRTK